MSTAGVGALGLPKFGQALHRESGTTRRRCFGEVRASCSFLPVEHYAFMKRAPVAEAWPGRGATGDVPRTGVGVFADGMHFRYRACASRGAQASLRRGLRLVNGCFICDRSSGGGGLRARARASP